MTRSIASYMTYWVFVDLYSKLPCIEEKIQVYGLSLCIVLLQVLRHVCGQDNLLPDRAI